MVRGKYWPVAAVAALACAGPAAAQSVESLAARFGATESVQDISLSPDGNKVLFLVPTPLGRTLYMADLVAGGEPQRVINQSNPKERISWCNFASNTRIVCQIATIQNSGTALLGFSRLVSFNADGSDARLLNTMDSSRSLGFAQSGGSVIDWDVPGKPGHVFVTRTYVPERTIGTRLASTKTGVGVDDLDTTKLTRSVVEQPRDDAVGYISDGKGTVRLMTTREKDASGYDRDRLSFFYRKPASRTWEVLSRYNADGTTAPGGFYPVAVDSGKNVVYGFDDHDGRSALYTISLDGTATRQLVLSRPDVDVDSLVRIGRDQRVVGASYATERRTIEFFDPELKKLGAALGKALPGKPNISFVDGSEGEAKLLLFASSDADPGRFYVFDKATRQLEEFLPVRHKLAGLTFGEMKPVTYTAADGTQIPAYLTLPPGSNGKGLPGIVMPHGGPGARDEWGFDWLAQYFAARGFAVIQPNFRGSTGYGADWYQKNGFQSWRTAIGDVNDAGRYLVSSGVAAPGKLAVFGWSYGGYAALQSPALDPDLFKAIVAVAPVTDLNTLREESRDFTNFPQVDAFIGHGPHVREGSPAQNAAAIKAPVLLFHGDLDQNVGVGESRLMRDRLKAAGKPVDYVEFEGLDHYLADGAARTRMLGDSDSFIRKALGMPAD